MTTALPFPDGIEGVCRAPGLWVVEEHAVVDLRRAGKTGLPRQFWVVLPLGYYEFEDVDRVEPILSGSSQRHAVQRLADHLLTGSGRCSCPEPVLGQVPLDGEVRPMPLERRAVVGHATASARVRPVMGRAAKTDPRAIDALAQVIEALRGEVSACRTPRSAAHAELRLEGALRVHDGLASAGLVPPRDAE